MGERESKDSQSDDLWISGNDQHRELDVFYTNYGTKLFVKNGILIEEKIEPSGYPAADSSDYCASANRSDQPSSSAPPSRLDPIAHSTPPQPSRESFLLTKVFAEIALEYYNKKHEKKYEFVDSVDCCGALWNCEIWYHCNFIAKCPEESRTKIFFAELKNAGFKSKKEYLVRACRPLDDGKTATEECKMCSKSVNIKHPTGRFHGRYDAKPRVRRVHPYDKKLSFPSKPSFVLKPCPPNGTILYLKK